jgi:chromosome segregation ATPase
MAEQAHVTSVEALEAFRASLILYLSKARPTLEEVSSEVLRTRLWLEHEQRAYWEHQIRRRAAQVEAAEQTLFGARMSVLRQVTDSEQAAVQRARRALEEAEARLRRVKQWCREFDTQIEPLARQLDPLRNFLTVDMAKAVASLAQSIKTLSDYASLAPVQEAAGLVGADAGTDQAAGAPADLPSDAAPPPDAAAKGASA